VKVLRRRERRILFRIEEPNAGKSVDLSSSRDEGAHGRPRSMQFLNYGDLFLKGSYVRRWEDEKIIGRAFCRCLGRTGPGL